VELGVHPPLEKLIQKIPEDLLGKLRMPGYLNLLLRLVICLAGDSAAMP
jgi:hypothetical protein